MPGLLDSAPGIIHSPPLTEAFLLRSAVALSSAPRPMARLAE